MKLLGKLIQICGPEFKCVYICLSCGCMLMCGYMRVWVCLFNVHTHTTYIKEAIGVEEAYYQRMCIFSILASVCRAR